MACGHHSAALTDTGEIYLWGTGVFGEFCSPIQVSQSGARYKDIDVGSFFGVSIDDSGLAWTWGSNTSGELGLADYEPRKSPFPNASLQGKVMVKVACGGSYVIALGNVVTNVRRSSDVSSPRNPLSANRSNFVSKTPSASETRSFDRTRGFASVSNRGARTESGLNQTFKTDVSIDKGAISL